MHAEPDLVRVGQVVKPHGLRGELVIAAFGGTLASLPSSVQLWIGNRPYAVVSTRPHQGRFLITVDGCGDRDAAERLRGDHVEVERGYLADLRGSEWYVDDLVGYQLQDATDGGEGRITAVVEGGPHDLLEVAWGDGDTVLIPMVREWFVSADPAARLIVVRLPDGLLEANVPRRHC